MTREGVICGGIIKESELKERLEEGTLEEVMMAYVMPDEQYEKYFELKSKGKHEEADKIFKKYAWSLI